MRYGYLVWLAIVGVNLAVLRKRSSNTPTLTGPGFSCDPVFDGEVLGLDTLLLCNKTHTSSGLGYNKTEIQTLNTAVLRLGGGECEQFKGKGFRCIEHYSCLSDSTLITDGASRTQIISLVTTVNVHTSVPGATHSYSFSILDATDKKCETYTKVCCGPKEETNKEEDSIPENPKILRDVTTITTEVKEEVTEATTTSGIFVTPPPVQTETETESKKTKVESNHSSVINTETTEPVSTEIVISTTMETNRLELECKVSDIVMLRDGLKCEEDAPIVKTQKCNVFDIVSLRDGLDCEDDEETSTSENPCKNAEEETIFRCNLLEPSDIINKNDEVELPRPEPPSDYSPKCGGHNPDGYRQALINLDEGLHESQFAEWPNMCAIMETGVYKCGASLISPNFVLTAAHCFNSSLAYTGTTVRCGDWDTATDSELYTYQELTVEQIVFHPGFDTEKGARGNLWNDIALVQTDKPFSLAPHVDTICLPRPGQVFHGSQCAATGWGKDRFGDGGRPQIILKEVWMKVVEQSNCEENLRKTKLGQFFVLDKSFICAGGEVDIDLCTGDGGSPLMCQGPDGLIQAGIVSWGVACGLNDVPGVYVKIGMFVCWIKDIIEEIEGTDYFPYSEDCD